MIVAREFNVARIAGSIGAPLLVLLAYDVAVTVLYVVFGQQWVSIQNLPTGLLGGALAIIVGLRNNTAYDRWWEARSLWGRVVNNSRSLARGALTVFGSELVTPLVAMQIAWVHALRLALWGKSPMAELERLLPPASVDRVRHAANVPAALQGEMARLLSAQDDGGTQAAVRLSMLDATLTALADAQGGLERIKNTPMPRQFEQFPRVFIAAYCMLLPVALVHDLGALTPIGSTVIGFAFYALDQIGRDLENPFAGTVHDVSMTAITRTIEVNLREMLGDTDTPGPVRPVKGVLI